MPPQRAGPVGRRAARQAPLARMHTRIGDSPKTRVGVVLALWVLAVLLGFAFAG